MDIGSTEVIIGKNEILDYSNKLLNKYKNILINHIPSGFELFVPQLPYSFEVLFYENVGWNVFLTSNTDEYKDDFETDNLYRKLDNEIDIVNRKYYYLSMTKTLF